MTQQHQPGKSYLHKISHRRIDPPRRTGQTPLPRAIDEVFLSYNAGRLREACRLYASRMLADDTVVGPSLSGALTPAGLGISCLVRLLEAGDAASPDSYLTGVACNGNAARPHRLPFAVPGYHADARIRSTNRRVAKMCRRKRKSSNCFH